MTFQTFKRFVLMSVFFMTTSVVIYAQQSTMQGLIGQSLAKLQQPTSELQPDSQDFLPPKHHR